MTGPGDAGLRVLAGLAEAGLPDVVSRASRLYFHAALYSNFAANSAMAAALDTALARPETRLEVVSLELVANRSWRDEFFDVLRQGRFPGDLLRDFAVSRAFLADLSRRHPGQVRLYDTPLLPLAPLLLVDDVIFVGHYLHGAVPAPDGLWLALEADVAGLLRLAQAGAIPPPGDGRTRAAFRFVQEYVAARRAACSPHGPSPSGSAHATA